MQDFTIDTPSIEFTTQDLMPIEVIPVDCASIHQEDETFLKVIGDLLLHPHKDEEKQVSVEILPTTMEEEFSDMACEKIEEEIVDEVPLVFLEGFPQVWEQVSTASQFFSNPDQDRKVEETETHEESLFENKHQIPTKEKLLKSDIVPQIPENVLFTANQDSETLSLPIELMLSKENTPLAPHLLKPLPKETNTILPLNTKEAKEWAMPEINVLENAQILPVSTMQNFVKEIGMPMPVQVQMREIALPVDEPDWGKEFNQQIVWIGQQHIKSAQIKLNPEALGPLNIHLSVKHKEATLHIASNNADVRDLIGHQIPELKERLQEQGLQLTKVNIEAEANASHAREQFVPKHQKNELKGSNQEDSEENLLQTTKVAVGIIDYFA